MALFTAPVTTLLKLQEALKLPPGRIKRIVIDVQASAVATVYVQMYADAEQMEAATNAIAADAPAIRVVNELSVNERGEVAAD